MEMWQIVAKPLMIYVIHLLGHVVPHVGCEQLWILFLLLVRRVDGQELDFAVRLE